MADSKTVDISAKAIDELALGPEVKGVLKDLQEEVAEASTVMRSAQWSFVQATIRKAPS